MMAATLCGSPMYMVRLIAASFSYSHPLNPLYTYATYAKIIIFDPVAFSYSF